jgi:hypothetical protein
MPVMEPIEAIPELSVPEVRRRVTKDVKLAAKTLTADQARFLVDAYYKWQNDRIRSGHQTRTLAEASEPHSSVDWLVGISGDVEKDLKFMLGVYAEGQVAGRWAMSQIGIGPVITAGLLAHIDIAKAPTVGHIWSFAGLNPTVTWNKGEKRPWNADLKRLCWLTGECFTKTANHEDSVYGKLYQQRKAIEVAKNTAGDFASQAAESLAGKKWRAGTNARAAYEQGKLPDARIHLRAQRWAVKIFLAHFHHVLFYATYQQHPPKPYVLDILKHGHEIQVPGWPF